MSDNKIINCIFCQIDIGLANTLTDVVFCKNCNYRVVLAKTHDQFTWSFLYNKYYIYYIFPQYVFTIYDLDHRQVLNTTFQTGKLPLTPSNVKDKIKTLLIFS